MVQNRRCRVSYKIRNLKKNKKEEWIIVKNTHEPIINKNDFQDVQRILSLNSNNKSNKKNEYILNGLLYCGECKKRIVIQKSGKYFYTMCNTYRKYSKLKKCTSHSCNYYKLEEKIFKILNELLLNIDKQTLIDNLKNKINIKSINEQIDILKNNLDKIYLDKINNKIKNEMYIRLKNKINLELNNLKNKQKIIEEFDYEKFVFNYVNNIDKKTLLRLIKKIELHSDKTIDIYFNFCRPKFIANE